MASAYSRSRNSVRSIIGSADRRSNHTKTQSPATATANSAQDERRSPAHLRAFDHRLGQRSHGHHEQQLTADIEAARPPVARFGDIAQREPHDQHAHRNIDEKDAAPTQVLDQHAAERGADGRAHARDRRPEPDRARLLLGVRKGRADERQRRHVGGGRGNPCTARAKFRISSVGENPHAIDASVNTVMPATYQRRRP